MEGYNYPPPKAPGYTKPTSIEDCLPQARLLVKKEFGRAAMGPIKKGDKILIVTFPDQDEYVQQAMIQACKEEGADKVEFMFTHELVGHETKPATAENPEIEAQMLDEGKASGAYTVADRTSGADMAGALRKYFDKHPEFTALHWDSGGRGHRVVALQEHGSKFRGNWLFNNWEEFLSRAWTYPDELWKEIERRIIDAIGKASTVRITDPEGTHLEYQLTAEEAIRWKNGAWRPGHLFLCPFQATASEVAVSPISPDYPPVIPEYNGVLAGTANHFGYFPRIELYFEKCRLVDVKGGGKYGQEILKLKDKYKDVHWPGYPEKGFFWFCDCALCTGVKAFRRTSDLFSSYWRIPNAPERNRAGVFHLGMGSRKHTRDHRQYSKENNIPMGHIHVHNYFATFEVKLQGTSNWYKIIDKGRITAMDDPEIRAIAVKYGDPDELLSYDWVPPLPGINCEGDYLKDYAPNPVAYLKKRIAENKSV